MAKYVWVTLEDGRRIRMEEESAKKFSKENKSAKVTSDKEVEKQRQEESAPNA